MESESRSPIAMNFMAERTRFAAPGFAGGADGGRGDVQVNGKSHQPPHPAHPEEGRHRRSCARRVAAAGDPPSKRDPALTKRDRALGYVAARALQHDEGPPRAVNAAPRVLPPEVSRVLDDFVTAARDVLADDLASIVLFGSAAEGALAATSDVNVVVVLHRFQRERVDALREPLRVAQAAIRLSPMFLLRDEIAVAAAAFAQKFADIGRRRRVLHGDDPFATMQVPRAALIARLDQVLLNLTLRLRAAYVERSLREEQLAPHPCRRRERAGHQRGEPHRARGRRHLGPARRAAHAGYRDPRRHVDRHRGEPREGARAKTPRARRRRHDVAAARRAGRGDARPTRSVAARGA